jgi:carboxypeptidase Taq
MPPGGAAARAEQLATLHKTAHDWFITDELGGLLDDLSSNQVGWAYDSDEASLLRVVARDYAKARKVPSALVAEFARVTALSYEAWTRVIGLCLCSTSWKRSSISTAAGRGVGHQDRIYDPLLDQFEPEMKTAK